MTDYTADFQEFRKRLKQLARGLVNSIQRRVDTSDVVQKFCVQISQQHDGDFSNFSTSYLNRALRGHASKSIRQHTQQCRDWKAEQPFVDAPDSRLNPEAIFLKREANARLARALDSLREDLQKVVFLRILADLTFPEIAEELKVSERRAQLAFERAITTLKKTLREDYLR